jgi:PAS domain S-box-containing protein
MTQKHTPNIDLVEENKRLRAQLAQLEDRLEHLFENGPAKSLHQSEALHREVLAVTSDAVLITDEAGRLKYVSPNAHFIFGHAAADILKQGRIGFLLPANVFDPDLLEQRGEISNIECRIRDSVGRARDLLITVRRSVSVEQGTLYVCRDVTERVKIERDNELLTITLERRVDERTSELRESRDQYRRLVEGLRHEYLFYSTDERGIINYVSPSIHTIMGYTPDQALGHNWREFVDTSTDEYAKLEEMDRMRFAGLPTPPFSAWVLHANGTSRLFEFRDVPLLDPDGNVIANEGIGKDITERHETEEALRRVRADLENRVHERTVELTERHEELRKSKELYRSVVQDHLEFIVRWHPDGICSFVSDSYCRYRGTDSDTLVGTDFFSSILEEDRGALEQKLGELSSKTPVIEHVHRVVKLDGHVGWERWTHRALFNQDGQLTEFQSVGSDFTERHKHLELSQARDRAAAQVLALTKREQDVMRLVVGGDANKVMARKLGLSIKTIEKHRGSLMKKLQVRSVPELVRLALLLGDCAEA